MTPEDRQLLMGLFDRMRTQGPIAKDAQAEDLIYNEVRQIPDSAYMLVQSVIVQDEALKAANARIAALEGQLRSASAGKTASAAATSPWAAAPAAAETARHVSSPWGRGKGASAATQAPQQQGGSFLKSAMATAAGVAGGMLLASGIQSMLGGNTQQAGTGTASTANADTTSTAASTPAETATQDSSNLSDADYSGGDDWGFDGGGDFEL